jgi:flagellar FliL protein
MAAAPRTDAPKEGAPGESTAEAGNPQPATAKAGLSAWLPLILSIVLMPVLAYLVTSFVLIPKMRQGLGITQTAKEEKSAGGEHGGAAPSKEGTSAAPSGATENVPMTKLLVNVAGSMGSRYLLASVVLVGNTKNFREQVAKNEAQLRDLACGVLATKTISDLEKPGARNLVRSELLTGFNQVLGGSAVQEIYLTEFAIQ